MNEGVLSACVWLGCGEKWSGACEMRLASHSPALHSKPTAMEPSLVGWGQPRGCTSGPRWLCSSTLVHGRLLCTVDCPRPTTSQAVRTLLAVALRPAEYSPRTQSIARQYCFVTGVAVLCVWRITLIPHALRRTHALHSTSPGRLSCAHSLSLSRRAVNHCRLLFLHRPPSVPLLRSFACSHCNDQSRQRTRRPSSNTTAAPTYAQTGVLAATRTHCTARSSRGHPTARCVSGHTTDTPAAQRLYRYTSHPLTSQRTTSCTPPACSSSRTLQPHHFDSDTLVAPLVLRYRSLLSRSRHV